MPCLFGCAGEVEDDREEDSEEDSEGEASWTVAGRGCGSWRASGSDGVWEDEESGEDEIGSGA